MAVVTIFTNYSCPNSRAFNFPLQLSADILRAKGYELKIVLKPHPSMAEGDILLVNSNVFRPFWAGNKDKIFGFLEALSAKGQRILWFDTTDSTWCTQFEVMPFVHRFMKAQLLVDKSLYLKPFSTGRIYTDFFDTLYSSGEREVSFPPAKKEDIQKIGVSWNSCFENYSENRYSNSRKLRNFLSRFTPAAAKRQFKLYFSDPSSKRDNPISCRVGTSHSRPSVAAHRRAVMEMLAPKNIASGKIPLKKFFEELRNSQIAVSPFGVGEITLRDFEIIICGAMLMKPDMSHLETWPDLYQPEKTYVPLKWDLSDLENRLNHMLEDPARRLEIAENAQKVYRHAISEEGISEFAERIIRLI